MHVIRGKKTMKAAAGLLLTALVGGCGSTSDNLSMAGSVYKAIPDRRAQALGHLFSGLSYAARMEEANQHWAHCPQCRRRQWWPRDGLAANQGRARCNCGCVFVIPGYGS